MSTSKRLPHGPAWETRYAVSIADAAVILNRSTSWVNCRLTDRSLEEADRSDVRAPVKGKSVTVASIVNLIARGQQGVSAERLTARLEPHWRDCALATPIVAAAILGYSVAQIRNLVFTNGLRAARLARSGPMFITIESIVELLDSADVVEPKPIKVVRPPAVRAPVARPPVARPPEAPQAPWRDRPFLQLKKAAEVVGVSVTTLYRFQNEGKLEFKNLGGRTLVNTQSLIALANSAPEWTAKDRGKEARAARKDYAKASLA
jgi:hypothetical protein